MNEPTKAIQYLIDTAPLYAKSKDCGVDASLVFKENKILVAEFVLAVEDASENTRFVLF